MMLNLFKKKNKVSENNDESVEIVRDTKVDNKSTKKRKKSTYMSSVINERVFDASLTRMKDNKYFIYRKNGEAKFVLFIVDVNAPMRADAVDGGLVGFGGLNRSCRKSHDKGQIIEAINGGDIGTYINFEYIDKEEIPFIIDSKSVSYMEEYELFRACDYKVAFCDESGQIEVTDITYTLSQIKDFLENDSFPFDEILGLEPVDDGEHDHVEEVNDEVVDNESPRFASLVDEPASEQLDISYEDDDVYDTEENVDNGSEFNDEPINDVDNYDDVYDEDMSYNEDEISKLEQDDYLEDYGFNTLVVDDQSKLLESKAEQVPVDDVVVNKDLVVSSLNKKTGHVDHELHLDLDSFEMSFANNKEFLFDITPTGSWLNEQIIEKAKTANADLQRMRAEHVNNMRMEYISLVSMHIDSIVAKTGFDNPTSEFYQAKKRILEEKEKALDNINETKMKNEESLRSQFEQAKKDYVESVAKSAGSRFERLHSPKLLKDINSLENNIKKEIESDYNDRYHELIRQRNQRTSTLLEFGKQKVLEHLWAVNKEKLKEEQEKFNSWANEINSYLDKYRESELARIQTLRDELDRSSEIDNVTADYENKIKAINVEFESSKQKLRSEMDDMACSYKNIIATKELEFKEKLEQSANRCRELEINIDKLTDKFADLDEVKAAEYENRIVNLQSDIATWRDRFDDMVATNRKANIATAVAALLFALALAGMGFIVGTNYQLDNINNTVNNNTAIIRNNP